MTTNNNDDNNFDVLIIGAGVSGLGSAVHLQRECPDKTFVLLEARNTFGGTWDLFKYPGFRSDSDMYTYQYDFQPWEGKQPIVKGNEILNYLKGTVTNNGLEGHIRYGHKVMEASWSTKDAMWTVTATTTTVVAGEEEEEDETTRVVVLKGNFLLLCQGYYNYEGGYRPKFQGEDKFKGIIIHPQKWPEDLDYTNKHMTVIGSGATAATIVPAVADKVSHVVQLQRSPTYYLPIPNNDEPALFKIMGWLPIPAGWTNQFKRNIFLKHAKDFTEGAFKDPTAKRKELRDMAAAMLPKDYDLETHLTPQYDPWRERLCLVPDGDLFKAISDGKASIVTDHIESFTEDGIKLKSSGETIKTDIIVTATGLELCGLGNIQFTVDGQAVKSLNDHWTYKGFMISDMPNLVSIFGYVRSSWTLRSDLIGHYTCRLLNYMDEKQVRQCTPRLRPEDRDMVVKNFVDTDDFGPGYILRGANRMPKQGDREPWTNKQDYYVERDEIPVAGFEDGVLQFEAAGVNDQSRTTVGAKVIREH